MSQKELREIFILSKEENDSPAKRLCEKLLQCTDLTYYLSVNDKSFFMCAAKDSRLPLLKFLYKYANSRGIVPLRDLIMYSLNKENIETSLFLLNYCESNSYHNYDSFF